MCEYVSGSYLRDRRHNECSQLASPSLPAVTMDQDKSSRTTSTMEKQRAWPKSLSLRVMGTFLQFALVLLALYLKYSVESGGDSKLKRPTGTLPHPTPIIDQSNDNQSIHLSGAPPSPPIQDRSNGSLNPYPKYPSGGTKQNISSSPHSVYLNLSLSSLILFHRA